MTITHKIIGFFALCCLAQTSIYSADTQSSTNTEIHKLETVTTKAKQEGYETSTKTLITVDDLEKTQATNLRDIFKGDPSIAVGGGANMGQKIYVRGFESFLMRVTLDGAAQNGNAFHHQGNVMVDPSLLKQVVVSKGVSDASSGPGGLAGSIAFETKDASDFLRPNQKFGAEIVGGFYTNFGYKTGINLYNRLFSDVGILASINHQNILNYRDAKHTYTDFLTTNNAVLGSNSMQTNALIKVGGQIDSNQKFSVGYSIIYDEATRPFRANIGDVAGENFASKLFRHKNQNQNFNANYEFSPENKDTKVKLTAYSNTKNISLTPLFDIKPKREQDPEGTSARAIVLDNYGIDAKVKNTFQETHLFEYGLGFQGMSVRDDNISQEEKDEIGVKHNRGREEVYILGVFVQDSWQILSNLKWGYGTRADLYYYYDKNKQDHFTGGLSPSTAIVYTIMDGLDISAKYAFSTRGAMPGDATLLRDTKIEINPNLKPEYSNHGEITLDYINAFMGLRFAIYTGNVLNFINSYSKGTGSNTSKREGVRENLNFPIINYGFELGSTFYYDEFKLDLGVARNWLTAGGEGKGALLADTYELGATWGYTFTLGLRYEGSLFDVGWFSRFVTGFDKGTRGYNIYDRQFEYIGRDGYTVSDVYVNYYPLGRDRLTLRFSISNIFNAFYVDPTSPLKVEADNKASAEVNKIRSALYEPGTNYRFEARYRF